MSGPASLSNFHPDLAWQPAPPSNSLHLHPFTWLPSLLTQFLLLPIQLGITGLHIIFCSTSESRLFKISVIFLSLCVYLMGLTVHRQGARVCFWYTCVASKCGICQRFVTRERNAQKRLIRKCYILLFWVSTEETSIHVLQNDA